MTDMKTINNVALKRATEKELNKWEESLSREIDRVKKSQQSLYRMCAKKGWKSTSERAQEARLDATYVKLLEARSAVRREALDRKEAGMVIASRKLHAKRVAEGYNYPDYDKGQGRDFQIGNPDNLVGNGTKYRSDSPEWRIVV